MSSKSKARLPAEPLISIRMAFLRPVANRVASKTPTAPPPKRARKAAVSSTVTSPTFSAVPIGATSEQLAPARLRHRALVDERLEQPVDVDDPVAGDVLGEVDDVGADVAERPGASPVLLEPPAHRHRGVREPVLEVLRAHVPDLPDAPFLHELAGQRDGRDTAVGEPDHRDHALLGGPLGRRGHRLGLGDRVGERLLAQHVLACLESGHGDLGVGVTGRADVDEVDVLARHQPGPVGLGRLPAEPFGGRGHPVRVPAAQSTHPGVERKVEEAGGGAPGLGVGRPHEGVPDHADAELLRGVWCVRIHAMSFGVGTSGVVPGVTGPDSVRSPPRCQDSKQRSWYSSTFSLVTTGASSTMRLGTATWTRSDMLLPCAIRRAILIPSAAWVGG